MMRWLPVLLLFAGLGSVISCKRPASTTTPKATKTENGVPKPPRRIGKPSTNPNPFDRYLANTKTNWPEPALVRFAGECHVDLNVATPKYAQRPNQKWIPVHDLSNALKDQETDFYGTVAAWHNDDRVLVEQWGMELDTGDYYRTFYCTEKKKITLVESLSWEVSLRNDNAAATGWGYEHRWKLVQNGKFETVSRRFVDLTEKPIAAPKVDAETQHGLDEESVGMRTLGDLDLPSELLR